MSSRSRTRGAFTLIELAAALLLLAVVAGLVAVSLRGPYRRAQLGESIEGILWLDHQARERARRGRRPLRLVLDLDSGRVALQGERSAENETGYRLPDGLSIDRFVSTSERVDYGRAVVRYTPFGASPTYALRLRGAGTAPRWLLVTGLSGEPMETGNESDIFSLLRGLSQRPDAR